MYDHTAFKGERIAFVGTGGGNDVFSCLLAAMTLKRHGWEWKHAYVAGILSPFHGHDVEGAGGYYRGTVRPTSKRFLKRRGEDKRPIGFIDAKVAELVEALKPCGIEHVFGLDIGDGTAGLRWGYHHLGVERIVLVDAGGDILGNWDDQHILSPMFDAIALRAAVEPDVPPCTLFEFGPGTDGELDPERLRAELLRPGVECRPLHADDVDAWEKLYKAWIEPTRPGRTVPYTIEAFRTARPTIEDTYRARAQLGGARWYGEFRHRIDADLCKRFYLLDPREAAARNPFAVMCGSPEDWFLRTQSKEGRCRNNEASLQYYMRRGRLLQFLTPSPLIRAHDRQDIIARALGEFEGHLCEQILLTAEDAAWVSKRWPGRFPLAYRQDDLFYIDHPDHPSH
ncbi:MAG TPA: DUF1152 domain-containing protein [Candidatus Baltobacteraceae bacterium]|nr:DUF1152 domain-containing protein [Candidatus Baltobacteraceae bacterium]